MSFITDKFFKNKLKHKLKIFFLALTYPNERERFLANQLRIKILELPKLPLELEDQWIKYRQSIREDIFKKDVRNFLNWGIIRSSMFHEAEKVELDYLKEIPNWPRWQTALKSPKTGWPRLYTWFKGTNGNLVHNAYLLAKLFDFSGLEISQTKHIIEFGGGYGAMALLALNLGFKGQYLIYDLPEFSMLQEYYLLSSEAKAKISNQPGALVKTEVILNYDMLTFSENIKLIDNIDLFIASWSISEAPLDFRHKFFNAIGQPKYLLIGYRNKFAQIDNLKYFQEFIKSRPNYSWYNVGIDHLPDNYILIGKLKHEFYQR